MTAMDAKQVSAPPTREGDLELLVRVRELVTGFPIRKGVLRREIASIRAVDGVDLDIPRGQTVGLVGESGCGKSTLGRTILRLLQPTSGRIEFDGTDIATMSQDELRPMRRRMQMIFQDPVGSLDPRLSVERIIGEGLHAQGLRNRDELRDRVHRAMAEVGFESEAATRLPHEFSGGQRQRIGIARALVLQPQFIVADEPVSALDVSIQSQVLNLLVDLRERYKLTYLFVAHDLAVVDYVADQIAVMYLGRIVEFGTPDEIRTEPKHPYTVALLSAVPQPDPDRRRDRLVLAGDVPSPISPPSGCRFRTRCPIARDICAKEDPALATVGSAGHRAACHFPGEMSADLRTNRRTDQSID